jgi:hypothetical protein
VKLRPLSKASDKRGSQAPISILHSNINMKMCRVSFTNVVNVPEIPDIVEMIQFCWISETTCEIPDRTPDVIKRNEKAVSMSNYIPSQGHLSKGLVFFFAAKITFRARVEKILSRSPR